MGFGILILGYLLLVTIPFLGGIDLHFIGYGIMYAALLRLIPYEDRFIPAKWTVLPLVPLCTLISGTYILRYFGVDVLSDDLLVLLEMGKRILTLVFHYFLLFAMRHLANDVGQVKIARKCLRNFILMLLYTVAIVVLNLPISAVQTFKESYLQIVVLVDSLWLILLLLNAVQIYSCYMRICPEGEEDLPMKENRLERFFREKLEKTAESSREDLETRKAELKQKKGGRKKK